MITAHYFDGHSARLHPVELFLGDGAIALRGSVDKTYARGQARLAEPFEHAPAVLYFADGARCEVADPQARQVLAQALGYRQSRVERWQQHTWAALGALVLLVALIGATAIWGVPAAAERIAASLPASADLALGRSALQALETHGILAPTRLSDERVAEVEQVLRRIAPPEPRLPLRVLVRDSQRLGANALALPDGTIVVTDWMIREILNDSADFDVDATAALAGVLAHEIGHVELRHSTQTLARSSLTAAGSAALFGDFSAVAASVPALLLNMRYSREMETEADEYAIGVLRAHGIATAPLADLFAALEEASAEDGQDRRPAWFKRGTEYMSSHPASAERGARLRTAAPQE